MVKEQHSPVISCLTCSYLQDHPLPTGTFATKLAPHQPIHRRRSHGQKSERDDFGRPGLNLSFSRVGTIAEKTLERWMIRADFGFGIGMRLRVAASGSIGSIGSTGCIGSTGSIGSIGPTGPTGRNKCRSSVRNWFYRDWEWKWSFRKMAALDWKLYLHGTDFLTKLLNMFL